MGKEEDIKQGLINNFSLDDEKVWIPRQRRIFMKITPELVAPVLEHLKSKEQFDILCTITGLDGGESFEMIYHLTRKDGIVVNIKTSIPKENPVIKSIIDQFPSSEIYEREVVDLLGIKVEGLPEGPRYPLPDSWPEGEYPLRKDWKPKAMQKEDD